MVAASILFGLGGEGTLKPIKTIVLTESQTWSPPFKMKALIQNIGGGASGGACGGDAGGNSACATGGGAGELAVSLEELNPLTTYTATIGAGGAARVASAVAVQALTGNDGGTTIFSGADITTVTANGGSGGPSGEGSGIIALSGGAGGTGGAGNQYTVDGGNGGDIDHDASSVNPIASATGGGSVGWLGKGHNGGYINVTANNLNERASGGGGVGGDGGEIDGTSSGDRDSYGGTCISTPAIATSTVAPLPAGQEYNPTAVDAKFMNVMLEPPLLEGVPHPGFYSNEYGTVTQPPGVGGAGEGGSANTLIRDAGIFAGGGGHCYTNTNAPIGGDGGRYGGGGGGGALSNVNATPTSGKGGDGVIIIHVLENLEDA